MDGAEALGHLCKWLGEEASLQLVVLTGLEKVLAEEQIFQVEDLVLLRNDGMLDTVFTKYVTRRKVEIALDRHALQVSGQVAGSTSGQAVGGRLASRNGRRQRAAMRQRLRRRASRRSCWLWLSSRMRRWSRRRWWRWCWQGRRPNRGVGNQVRVSQPSLTSCSLRIARQRHLPQHLLPCLLLYRLRIWWWRQ